MATAARRVDGCDPGDKGRETDFNNIWLPKRRVNPPSNSGVRVSHLILFVAVHKS